LKNMLKASFTASAFRGLGDPTATFMSVLIHW